MKHTLLFILLCLSFTVRAQDDVQRFEFTSMVDFGTFEQAQASGAPDITLPLYDIELFQFRYPVALKYNLMGSVHPNHEGEQFGDAWNLNALGTINRSVHSTSYDYGTVSVGVYDSSNKMVGTVNMIQQKWKQRVFDELYYVNNPAATEREDGERDIFEFSILGLTGKFFVYKSNGQFKARILESSDYCTINILYDTLEDIQIDGFEITDARGYKYILDAKSNIDRNVYYHLTIGSTVVGAGFNPEYRYIELGGAFGNLNPAANGNGSGFNGTVYAFEGRGTKYWQSMYLSKVYDKDNNLLLSFEYDNFDKAWIDDNYSYAMSGGMNLRTSLVVKKIQIQNKGSLSFENVSVDNYRKMMTNKMVLRDLKGTVLKTVDFEHTKTVDFFRNRGLSKYQLTKITDNSNTAAPQMTYLFYKKYPASELDYDILGYVSKMYYKRDFLSSDNFRADHNALQKIKYPTGGCVLYSYESHNVQRPADYCTTNNLDNQVFSNVTTTVNNGQYEFNATAGDKLFILNANGAATAMQLYRKDNNTLVLLGTVANRIYDGTMGGRIVSTNDNYYDWYRPSISVTGTYVLKMPNAGTLLPLVRKLTYKPLAQQQQYVYIEGLRLKEMAYFSTNVAQNLLDKGTTQNAEKYVRFHYTDTGSNTSSGRNGINYIMAPHPNVNPVFYNRVGVESRGIGTRTNTYNTTSTIPDHTRLQASHTYDAAGNLLEEASYTRENVWYTSLKKLWNGRFAEPFEKTSAQYGKTYENGLFTTSVSESRYDTSNRQLTSSEVTDALGKVVKTEYDYAQKGNALVNTDMRSYTDGTLDSQVRNSYDTAGNLIKTEFKTPDMATYEKTGQENTKYINGLLVGYTQADGTPVTLAYGYNGTQVIAKIVNLEANTFYSATYQPLLTNLDNYSNPYHSSYSEANLKNTLEGMRTTFAGAQITSYTYQPLVGVSSITDAGSKTTTYEYDANGRLRTVKDHLGNILKEYQYNVTN